MNYPTGQVPCATVFSSSSIKRMLPEDQQEILWKQFFAEPSQWLDNRRNKPTPHHPDFQHKTSKSALWLRNRRRPGWVDLQLAAWDAGPKDNPDSLIKHEQEGHSEVGLCRKLCEDGRISDALETMDLLVQRGCHVDNNLFYNVLKWCNLNKDLALGRRVHALTVKGGYEGDAFLATHLIVLYASHGRLEEALQVFNKIPRPDAYNWATILFAYARCEDTAGAAKALQLYKQLRDSTSVHPDNRIYSAVLKACAAARDLVAGKKVHGHILASKARPDIYVLNGLVDMYAKCGSVEDARRVFDRLPHKDTVTWNVLLAGYVQQGMGQEALGLYRSMQQEGLSAPDSVTYGCLLQACATLGARGLHEGKEFHAAVRTKGLEDDIFLGCNLVNMYVKCGSLEDARSLFDRLPEKDAVTWNALLAGYAQQGMGREALSLHISMQQNGLWLPDSVTYVCLLQACASIGIGALKEGKQLHAAIREKDLQDDVNVACSLVNMYAKCGSLEDARRVFDVLSARNVTTWTAIIAAYAQQGMGEEALRLYKSMKKEGLSPPDSVTYICLLQACASGGVGSLFEGKQLHAKVEEQGLQEDVVVGGSLVSMYVKCGSLGDARMVFDRLPARNIVAWNAILGGYAHQGMAEEAFALYSSMRQEGVVRPNAITYVSLLQACSVVAALPLGKQVHTEIEEQGMQADMVVGAALVNMYSKCGSMSDSQRVFDALPERSDEAWGALISGHAHQGDSDVVFELFDRMMMEGKQPDGVTFLSVLTVCSHVGLVDKGLKYFEAMRTDHGINPTVEHFTCMMDLLGRAGHLDDALHMAKTMPLPPKEVVWLTLLGACQKWKNIEIGQQAFEGAVSVNEKGASPYVLMSNIYASAQMWEAAEEVQARRKTVGAWKKPGESWWTDLGGVVHAFIAGDKKLPETEDMGDTHNWSGGHACRVD